ncbi:hypothetical protein Avbf_07002 [Armadillidium vulgare]|nr:hypothetical protein Avbf_07002 [Armadillidium vulgare]
MAYMTKRAYHRKKQKSLEPQPCTSSGTGIRLNKNLANKYLIKTQERNGNCKATSRFFVPEIIFNQCFWWRYDCSLVADSDQFFSSLLFSFVLGFKAVATLNHISFPFCHLIKTSCINGLETIAGGNWGKNYQLIDLLMR